MFNSVGEPSSKTVPVNCLVGEVLFPVGDFLPRYFFLKTVKNHFNEIFIDSGCDDKHVAV